MNALKALAAPLLTLLGYLWHTVLQVPRAWWRELASMQRNRYIWQEVENLLNQEYRLRQDLQALEIVKHLHDDMPVRERACARQFELERALTKLRGQRHALQQEAARLPRARNARGAA